jgi:hypothetical protein
MYTTQMSSAPVYFSSIVYEFRMSLTIQTIQRNFIVGKIR